ncbi:hypothetical protein C8T65DRAFT_694318 [Cerioporus squamosus]|nr:hypothetical protein C8T65DRAFT_694318 [Cerioporus squamosus]
MLPFTTTAANHSHHLKCTPGTCHAVRIPPPPRPALLLLIARWKSLQEAGPKTKAKALKHRYELVIRPDEPIVTGRCVRILATSPIAYSSPDVPTGELDTYDPHLIGRVVEVWRAEEDPSKARARVMNTCRRNRVREVELDLPIAFSGLKQTFQAPECGERSGDPHDSNVGGNLSLMACVRPAPVWRECVGDLCCNRRRDLPILALV